MNTERIAAQRLASHGRFGDTMLLHVNPIEMAGIASLVPGGLTINPVTGLPEAFLPFLLALLGGAGGAGAAGAAAAGAAAAGTAAAAAAPALTAGLAAGAGAAGAAGLAAAPALATTLGAGALTPTLAAGTGLLASAAPAAGTLAAAAPLAAIAPAATTGGIGSLLGTGAIGAAGAPLAATLPAAASVAPAASGLASLTAPSAGSSILLGGAGTDALTTQALTINGASQALAPGNIGAGMSAAPIPPPGIGSGIPTPLQTPPVPTPRPIVVNPAGQSYAMGAGSTTPIGSPSPVTPLARPEINAAQPGGGVFGGISGGLSSLMKNPMALMALSQLGGMFKGGGKKKDKGSNFKQADYKGGPAIAAPAGYRPGLDPEFLHFSSPTTFNRQYFANGGIVGLAGGGMPPIDPQAQMPQDMGFPLNDVPGGGGIADLAGGPEEIPTSPFPTEQIGSQPEPPAGEDVAVNTENDQELVMQMVEVIQGKHPEPEPVIKAFIQEFGEQALQDLVQRVKGVGQPPQGGPAAPPPGPPGLKPGGPSPMDQMPPMPPMGPPPGGPPPQQGFAIGGAVGGRGDGLSDSVPAMIDGSQPAALSRGEFVIPADAVSGLGNGSTDAGAEQLQSMVNNVRMARGGTVGQAPPIQGGIAAMMAGGPVGYKKGGKVKEVDPPSVWEFLNPFSAPPNSGQPDLTMREVIVPPPSNSQVQPPSWYEFLNPLSAPPSYPAGN